MSAPEILIFYDDEINNFVLKNVILCAFQMHASTLYRRGKRAWTFWRIGQLRERILQGSFFWTSIYWCSMD